MSTSHNTLDRDEKRKIAGQARTIHERVNSFGNVQEGPPPNDPDEIIEKWKRSFPSVSDFYDRLEREDLSENEIREQILSTHWPSNKSLPEWMDTLESITGYITASQPPQNEGHDQTPFRELLYRIAEYARDQLPNVNILDKAVDPAVDWLLARLSALCVRPLFVEFKSYIKYHDESLLDAKPKEFEELPTDYYDEFIVAMFNHGTKEFFKEYPVLARQVSHIVEYWIDYLTDIHNNILSDMEEIKNVFGVCGNVEDIRPLSDDTHGKGRVPMAISFENNDVIYKPKNVDAGETFYTILQNIKPHIDSFQIKIPDYVSRDGYGWMEEVEYEDISNEDLVSDYYKKAGTIACIAYSLNFADLQYENLIVDGNSPMVIDGETIFHPHIDPQSKLSPTEIAAVAQESVLHTLLSPWSIGDSQSLHDDESNTSHQGLGSSSEPAQSDVPTPGITNANTDLMDVGEIYGEVDMSTNTPTVNNVDYPPSEFVDELTEGFTNAHQAIRSLHEEEVFFGDIVTPNSVENVKNRLVFRSTARYSSILQNTSGREPLQDGSRLSLEFEQLLLSFYDESIGTKKYWDLYEFERKSLRRRDIPRFTSYIDDNDIYHDDKHTKVQTTHSGLEQSKKIVSAMDQTDQERQNWLLSYSFAPEVFDVSENIGSDFPSAEFETEAIRMFDDAIDSAVENLPENQWVSITLTKGGIKLYPTDPSIYHGRSGIALTSAALYSITDNKKYRKTAEKILSPVLNYINEDDPGILADGLVGIGSVIYSLSVIAELLDSDIYQREAKKAALLITEDHFGKHKPADIMEGTAGTLLGLLAYYERYGGQEILNRAITCGDQLLEKRCDEQGYKVWESSDGGPPLTGFSHGAGGIAYALARLSVRTNESRFASAAYEAVEFESSLYSDTQANWAKSYQNNTYDDKWCHGRTGIALSRIKMGDLLQDKSLLEQGQKALTKTRQEDMANLDHLCCGNLGRSEALLVGAHHGSRKQSSAIEIAKKVLSRQKKNGILSMTGHSDVFANPTFFHGLSGAAYTLLRLQNPEKLPSILAME